MFWLRGGRWVGGVTLGREVCPAGYCLYFDILEWHWDNSNQSIRHVNSVWWWFLFGQMICPSSVMWHVSRSTKEHCLVQYIQEHWDAVFTINSALRHCSVISLYILCKGLLCSKGLHCCSVSNEPHQGWLLGACVAVPYTYHCAPDKLYGGDTGRVFQLLLQLWHIYVYILP